MPIVAIPGYAEACVKERTLRLAAFADVPRSVCGVDVWPITCANVVELELCRSPFVPPVERDAITPLDCARLLWAASDARRSIPAWLPFKNALAARRKRAMGKIIGRLPFEVCAAECADFVETCLQDMPAGRSAGGPSFVCWTASLIYRVAEKSGWSERDLLAMPMSRLLQYHRVGRMIDDPKAILFNPSDKVRSDYLRSENGKPT